jgi:hypothetical protein
LAIIGHERKTHVSTNGRTKAEPATTAAPATTDIVAVLAAAGEEDLERVQARVADLTRELKGLKTVETVLMARLGREKPKATKTPRVPRAASGRGEAGAASKGVTSDRRIQIAKYLVHCGTARPAIIAKDLEIPDGSITFVLDHPWFVRDVNGIKLSPEGRQAAGAA